MNMPRPVIVAITNAPQVQGTNSLERVLIEYFTAAIPRSRKSTIKIEPTTNAAAIT